MGADYSWYYVIKQILLQYYLFNHTIQEKLQEGSGRMSGLKVGCSTSASQVCIIKSLAQTATVAMGIPSYATDPASTNTLMSLARACMPCSTFALLDFSNVTHRFRMS